MIIPVCHSIVLKTIIPPVHKVADLVIGEVLFETIQGKVLNTSQSCLTSGSCNINPWSEAELACACLILLNNISFQRVSSIIIKTLGEWGP